MRSLDAGRPRARTTVLRLAALTAAAALPLALAGTAGAAPHPGAVPVAADTSHPGSRLGAVPAASTLSLAVALAPRDRAGLAAFDAAVSDPHSPQYRHFLTARQYADRFAPDPARVAAVRDYLTDKGLRVTRVAANRQVVDVTGPASAVTAAFGTTIGSYRDTRGTTFHAADAAATVPADLAATVASVTGLSDRPFAVHAAAPAGTGPNGGESPADLRTAYDMGSVVSGQGGGGRTVGLLEFDGFRQADVNSFTSRFGLPSLRPKVAAVDGGVSSLGSGQVEVTLDIDSVAAFAPKAAQVVYEAPNTDNAWVDEWAQVAGDNAVDVFSGSWLIGEACDTGAIAPSHDSVNQMVAEGITVLSASGDWGGHGCDYQGDNRTLTADYPASDPGITGVGGTALRTGANGAYASERVWNSGSSGSTRSGGQYSSDYATPSYQKPFNSNAKRAVADVSMAGDPNAGGLAIVVNGGWETIGGTSEAAPLWAGFQADVVQHAGKRLGNINPALYAIAGSSSYGANFHDVTTGNNDTYNAGKGYDLPTGIGTPIGAALLGSLTG